MELLLEKSGKSKRRIYWMIQKKRETYHSLVSKEDSAYLLALEMGIDVYPFVSKEKVAELRSLVLKVPIVRVVREKDRTKERRGRVQVQKKYLDIRKLPDDFYYSLIGSINKSFSFEVYIAVNLLVRKSTCGHT